MLKKVALGFVVFLALLLVVVATRPAAFRIERSANIDAPAAVAFGLVNDFHKWPAWSPWEKLDPGMKKEFSGAAAGEGSVYFWSGNDQVGEGRMTVIQSNPVELVGIKLEFLKPWTATNTATFTFKPAGSGTLVTWAMEGNNDFMGKAFSLFMDMDSMVGKDFERGLAGMKVVAEAEAKGSVQ